MTALLPRFTAFLFCLIFVVGTAQAQPQCKDFSDEDCMVPMAWAALTQWADAWSKKDYTAYINSYDKNAAPQLDKSRQQWLAARKRALSGPNSIKISLHLIDVQFLDIDIARATFIQRYTAPHYSDIVLKTFRLKLLHGQVKILTEVVDRSLAPLEADKIIDEFGY